MLPESLIRQHQLVPVTKDGNRVTIAMVNPNNLVALDEIKMRLKGMQVKLVVCAEEDFCLFMEKIYSGHLRNKEVDDGSEVDRFIDQEIELVQKDASRS